VRSQSIIASLAVTIALAFGHAAAAQPAAAPGQNTWNGCCGVHRWPMGSGMMGGPGMMGPGMMGPGGRSMQRHHFAMMSGIPSPYESYRNPLPQTRETVDKGGAIYEKTCMPCHGPTGQGDGEAGRNLSPPPGNLAWLSQMPMVRWDPFMYWTIAEGGAAFGTAMPAFKGALSENDIWAVTAYIQARLPERSK
jgi:mono/diheme cytochrome c family protein